MTTTILIGDCIEQMRTLPDGSFDSIVTDPPYELSFMQKKWDSTGIAYNVAMWKECYRVLKPGGHLLSFGGSRTYHRMACAVEDAGFEIRDQVMWIYGSGFPKSLDVGKALDRMAGVEREVVGVSPHFSAGRSVDNFGVAGQGLTGQRDRTITAPATEAAKKWDGFGTALKPSHEPLVLARKPLIGTVAENVLKHGCGALNIDGCRVGTGSDKTQGGCCGKGRLFGGGISQKAEVDMATGRWPANLCHDGSDEVVGLFPNSNGQAGVVKGTEPSRTGGNGTSCYGEYGRVAADKRGDSGSAARFFFCAKASKQDRNEGLEGHGLKPGGSNAKGYTKDVERGIDRNRPVANHHPTVKPHALMRWLCRLITPPQGNILDPFMGSGSTGKAAIKEGFSFTGIELDPEYAEIAKKRIEAVKYVPKAKVLPRYQEDKEVRQKLEQMEMFV